MADAKILVLRLMISSRIVDASQVFIKYIGLDSLTR